jgi:type VI secretion system secreted protein VgrG
VAKNRSESVDGGSTLTVAKEFAAKAKTVKVEAEDEVVIKTGDASITMKKNGDVTIEGKKITIKGSGDLVLKGAKIAEN